MIQEEVGWHRSQHMTKTHLYSGKKVAASTYYCYYTTGLVHPIFITRTCIYMSTMLHHSQCTTSSILYCTATIYNPLYIKVSIGVYSILCGRIKDAVSAIFFI